MDVDVLVVGAGPTGMALAGELRLAGAPVLLVDRLARRSALSKAGGVQSRVLEVFDQHGLLEPLLATGDHPTGAPPLRGRRAPAHRGTAPPHPWRSIPQVVVEGVLEQHLAERGVHVRREHELTALAQDGESVTATFAGGAAVRCRYLVAADVRLAGHDSTSTHTRGADGNWASVFPLGVDQRGRPLHRLSFGGPGRSPPRERPVTEDEIRDGLRAVFGDRVRLLDLRYARRITNAARQVENYRHGRVLLAGDAAHAHLPIGAQGMNTGIGDAVNLGWKLAAAVHGWAPEHLLDTYHAERHPVGAAVLRNVQAQSLLMDQEGAADPDLIAARDLFTDLARLPQVQHHLDDVLSGTGIRYPMPNAGTDPLVGLPAPDHDLGPVRSHELLRSGRGLLLDPTTRFADVAAPWGGPGGPGGGGDRGHAGAHPPRRLHVLDRRPSRRRPHPRRGTAPLVRRPPLTGGPGSAGRGGPARAGPPPCDERQAIRERPHSHTPAPESHHDSGHTRAVPVERATNAVVRAPG